MPIPFTNYIDIESGVGAGTSVSERDLIIRIFTENALVPTNSFIEFNNPDDVGVYFGTTSEEYLRAVLNFGWVSKSITRAKKISYARWANVATAPQIFGDQNISQALASYTSITAGSFILTMGGSTLTLSPLDFSSAGSLAGVAGVIQTAIQAKTAGGTVWTGATVTFDATRGTFNLTGGVTGVAPIKVTAGVSVDVAAQLGWLSAGTILSAGAAAQTLTDCMISSTTLSSNFGSFLFIPTLNETQKKELGTWTNGTNVKYAFLTRAATYSDAQTLYTDLLALAGNAVTYAPTSTQYPEMIPGIIAAATDYTAQNSVQNYMFQTNFPVDATVTNGTDAANFDNVRCNYYGNTQTAGQILQFYQRGVLMGGATAPVDMNVYYNEMWLKDAAGSRLMQLLLDQPVVSANVQGQGQVLGVLQSVIDQALFNGTISVGKPLDQDQIEFINTVTGSDRAWRQVQNIGYWVNAVITSETTQDGRREYQIVYTLIYSKDDAIRKIIGRHILI